jgi:DNA helicase IV
MNTANSNLKCNTLSRTASMEYGLHGYSSLLNPFTEGIPAIAAIEACPISKFPLPPALNNCCTSDLNWRTYNKNQDLLISNIQEFSQIVGSRRKPLALLLNRTFNRLDPKVEYRIFSRSHRKFEGEKDSKYFTCGTVTKVELTLRSKVTLEVDYGEGFVVTYQWKYFVEQFCEIFPPIETVKILELVLSNREMLERNKREILNLQSWLHQNLDIKLDLEQTAAVGAVGTNTKVIARAGSGKTSTLVSRAVFLQKYCGVAPSEILLLAFNKKAAEEIQERLKKYLVDDVPHVMTFHALAYRLVHPEETLIYDEANGSEQQSRSIQTTIDEYLKQPEIRGKIRDLMMEHFQEDWHRIIFGGYDKNQKELLEYRQSLPNETLDGKYVKSFGEKTIANFLFEHNIFYKYEKSANSNLKCNP